MKFTAFFEIRQEELNNFIETWRDRLPSDARVRIVLPPQIFAENVNGIRGFVVFESNEFEDVTDYLTRFESAGARIQVMPVWEDSELARELANFREGKEKTEFDWQRSVPKRISNWGSTKTLKILPLVDWEKSREGLEVEPGVSYLIKTDEKAILFDVGLNAKMSHPSPLLHNMDALGISLNDFDAIVISHNHHDHVGGGKWAKEHTFSLSSHQMDLGQKTVYTPIPMTYPGLQPIHAENPTIISAGVSTIGIISNYLFQTKENMGYIREQALAINVEEKGIVLVVGCGHQTLQKIIERTEALFEEPIYGLIGGLHYAVNGGPFKVFGMYPHQYFGTWKLPWQPITKEELQGCIQFLKERNLKVIGISPHDSSQTSLTAFRKAFPTEYVEIKVGQIINI